MAAISHPDEAFGTTIRPDDPNPLTLKPEPPNTVPGSAGSARDDVDIDRLRESMEWSATQMIPFRERHTQAIRMFAGPRYGRTTGAGKTPLNMIKLAVNIYVRQLVSQDPRALALTNAIDLKADAYELEIAANHVFRSINLGESLARVVQDAMFTMGVMKIGLSEPYLPKASGMPVAGGQVFAEPVLFEDWLHDFSARSLEECDWYGNRYRIPLQSVLNNPNFDDAAKQRLDRDMGKSFEMGESTNKESTLSGGGKNKLLRNEYRSRVELWDIYLPADKLIVTIAADTHGPPLAIKPWIGPEDGPYRLLRFSPVPGNFLPTAPIQDMCELQELLTMLMVQLGQQATRQKTITIVDGQAEADGTGERVMNAVDGQVIRTSHVDGVREMKYGGVDPGNLQFVDYLRNTFSYMGGNLEAMGGLAQQAKTLGQEQLLAATSSEMLRDMQAKVLAFTKKVQTDISWWMYTDPVNTYHLTKEIEGFGELSFDYGPQNRKADFFKFNIDISPYSLQSKGPQERLQSIMQIAQNLLLPMAPQLGEWGMQLNFKKLIELIGKYSDLPEIADIISSQQPMLGTQLVNNPKSSSPRRPLQSPSTTRTYVRENVSAGPTLNAKTQESMNNLMKVASE